ncbi:hypothetical protein [Roseiconus lacunae]|uniref:VWFA domain-containing protein n=1 Tax=Roseiconus lacunae TaxID=2605694 RepID=A0ABT7PE05_9BACT|nr:hypothetical protein [Roseiconus lacunae]MDM4014720.1 hypothetical protein [Roseiconus lacunae]
MSDTVASTTPRPRWQGESVERSRSLRSFRLRVARWFWPILVGIALTCFAGFVWLLTLVPKRTPLLVFTPATYQWPVQPLGWAAEDIQRLNTLDRQTLSIEGGDDQIRSASDFLRRFAHSIDHANRQWTDQPLIVLLNLHGVTVNKKAYLIPPDASQKTVSDWIPIEELIKCIANGKLQRNTLLVFDCNHFQVNWNLGIKANSFSSELQKSFQQAFDDGTLGDNVAVIMSSQDNEFSRRSAGLRASVFGHFFHLGLAGAADRSEDGWISLTELGSYVGDEVSEWVSQNRNSNQTPLLLRRHGTDFVLARSLEPGALSSVLAHQHEPAAPTVADIKLDQLWESFQSLRQRSAYRAEPVEFRDLEHQLLWLEHLATAGIGYRQEAIAIERELTQRFFQIENRIAVLPITPVLSKTNAILSGRSPFASDSATVPSLGIATLLGAVSPDDAQELETRIANFVSQPNPDSLRKLTELDRTRDATPFGRLQFLAMLRRYQTTSTWQRPEPLQALLQSHQRLNRLGIPFQAAPHHVDLRVHGQLRKKLEPALQLRRQLDDQLFSGIASSPDVSRRLTKMIESISKQAFTMDSSLHDCDRLFATTPYLAAWLSDPRRNTRFSERLGRQIEEVVSLIDGTAVVAKEVCTDDSQDETSALNDLRRQHQAIVELLQHEVRLATKACDQNQSGMVDRIDALLDVPTLDFEQRSKLRSGRRNLAIRCEQSPHDQASDNSERPTRNDYIAWINSLSRHPLDAILDKGFSHGEQVTGDPVPFAQWIDTQIRRSQTHDSLAGRLAELNAIALRARIAAPVWYPPIGNNPNEQLLKVNVQSLLVWHGEQTLVDFWGNMGTGQSYFYAAVTAFADASTKLDRMTINREIPEAIEIKSLREGLHNGNQALRNWVRPSVKRAIQIDAHDTIRLNITIECDTETKIFPSGIASIRLKVDDAINGANIVPDSQRVHLPASQESKSITFAPPASVTNTAAVQSTKASTIFRGHEFDAPLNIQTVGGVTIAARPADSAISDIRVTAPSGGLSVGFVLDGSASMKERLAENVSKIDIAKETLQSLLLELAGRGETRASVHAFGHRVGWSTSVPLRIIERPAYVGRIPDNLHPSNDIECLHQLRHLSVVEAQQVNAKVSQVEAWGQSPLYTAIKQSLLGFSTSAQGDNRHLIVITDGQDYEFKPEHNHDESQRNLDGIRQAWQMRDVPIHILGLGLDRVADAESVKEFEQLSHETGGQFFVLDSSTDLKVVLSQLLQSRRFEIENLSESQWPTYQRQLGSTVRLQIPDQSVHRFAVRVESDALRPMAEESVVLQGGESIQLYLDSDANQLFAFPFDQDVIRSVSLLNESGIPANQLLRVHRPRQSNRAVDFRVSLQTMAGASLKKFKATSRPQNIWVAIQPIDGQRQPIGGRYVFCDPIFEESRSVPVMKFRANQWPENATQATFEIYIDAARSNSPQTEGLSLDSPLESSSTVRFEPAKSTVTDLDPTTTLQCRISPKSLAHVTRIQLIVRCSDDPNRIEQWIVMPTDRSKQRPVRIERQYDPSLGIAVHMFEYEGNEQELIGLQFIASDRETKMRRSWRLPQNVLNIKLPPRGGLIPTGQALSNVVE